jgi:Arc/MetJ-type ribon-helix-helix transcriptional regulator
MVPHVQPETVAAIRERVERGEYEDADAVVRAALEALALDELRALLAESDAQYERGEYDVLSPELMDRIEQEADELARSGAPLRPHVCP